MLVKKLHHVAYRCADAQETVDFYSGLLGVPYKVALSSRTVPSTGEPNPHLHIFFEMEDGSYIAFFELPEEHPMGRDPHTPDWVQHLALEVQDRAALEGAKAHLEAKGVDVVGPTDHSFCQSIYFRDPSGHRVELTYRSGSPQMMERLEAVAQPMLEEWNRTKSHVPLADWVHEKQNKAHDAAR